MKLFVILLSSASLFQAKQINITCFLTTSHSPNHKRDARLTTFAIDVQSLNNPTKKHDRKEKGRITVAQKIMSHVFSAVNIYYKIMKMTYIQVRRFVSKTYFSTVSTHFYSLAPT
jgi:hypothetical protein